MTELIEGEKYSIKFVKSSETHIYELIKKHESELSHEILYTFIKNNGEKIMFTNSIIKNGRIIISSTLDKPIKLVRVNAFPKQIPQSSEYDEYEDGD